MYSRRPLIYARYSSDLQSDKSNEDQDREARALFRRHGIDDTDAFVFYDAAESGTKNNRTKFLEALELVRQGRVSVFGVDDRARASRNDEVVGVVKDIVYYGILGSVFQCCCISTTKVLNERISPPPPDSRFTFDCGPCDAKSTGN